VAHNAQRYLLFLRGDNDEELCKLGYDVGIDTATRFNWGIVCTRPLRRIQLWSAEISPPPTIKIKGARQTPQELIFLRPSHVAPKTKRGYGMAVMPGFHYEIAGVDEFPGGTGETSATFEYSDTVNGDVFNEPDFATFTFIRKDGATRTCLVDSQHDRTAIGFDGAFMPGPGIGACTSGDETEPPVTEPWTTKAPTTPAPTPVPPPTPRPIPFPPPPVDPQPAPSPMVPAPPGCSAGCTHHNRPWPEPVTECEVAGLVGTEIATTNPLRKCEDCAERCWFQIADCIGFLAHGEGDIQECTYYSSIEGTLTGVKDKRAVVKPAALRYMEPIPEGQLPGYRTPNGCNEHHLSERHEWPIEALMCIVLSVEGEVIRTDEGVRFDEDCTERCFLQMEDCEGFSSDKFSHNSLGRCTYYKNIKRVETGGASTIAVTEFALINKEKMPMPTAPPAAGPSPTPPSPSDTPFLSTPLGIFTMAFTGAAALFLVLMAFKRRRNRHLELFEPQQDVEFQS